MLAIRRLNLILFILCCTLILAAYTIQFMQAALPCCLCVIQRLALIALAASFLLCALHQPKARALWGYTIANVLFLVLGLAASGRQIWLQNQSIPGQNMCIPTLPSAINHPSLLNALNSLGTHQCAEAGPYFLGLSLSLWTFLFFCLLAAGVLIMSVLCGHLHKK